MTNSNRKVLSLLRNNIGFICFMLLMFASRSSIADWYYVPSGSMQPTVEIGDRIFVNKMAYRFEVPFTDIPIMELDTPERGDIVVFESSAANNRLIKRLVAVPGDTVAMYNNRLVINGRPAEYEFSEGDSEGIEHLQTYSHTLKITSQATSADYFAEVIVPKGHYLVLGDNRNNSADSRYYGFVPVSELQGKAIKVIASFDPDNYYKPRTERFFTPLI